MPRLRSLSQRQDTVTATGQDSVTRCVPSKGTWPQRSEAIQAYSDDAKSLNGDHDRDRHHDHGRYFDCHRDRDRDRDRDCVHDYGNMLV